MLSEIFLKEDTWKAIIAAITAIGAIWKGTQYIFNSLRSGKITKLRYLHKEYGDCLDIEDKDYISKILKQKVMTQVTGVTNNTQRSRLIYIANHCDLNLPKRTMIPMAYFLQYNGKYFYFKINNLLRIRRLFFKALGFVYAIYVFLPFFVFIMKDGEINTSSIDLIIGIVFSLGSLLISIYCFKRYPNNKQIMGINGKMLKAGGGYYKGN